MLVAFPYNYTQACAVGAYNPLLGSWSWTRQQWGRFDETSLMRALPDLNSPLGALVNFAVPSMLLDNPAHLPFVLLLIGLDLKGTPITILDAEVVGCD